MGCPCRNKKKKEAKKTTKRPNSVPNETRVERMTHCKNCEFSTKTNRNGTQQVTIKSTCQQSNQLIHTLVKDPRYACPIGRFEKLR